MVVVAASILTLSASITGAQGVPQRLLQAVWAARGELVTRIVVDEFSGRMRRGCRLQAYRVEGILKESGRHRVRLVGRDGAGRRCQALGVVRVRVFARVPVVRRAVAAGQPLAGAVVLRERPLRRGMQPGDWIEAGAVAARPLRPNTVVRPQDVRRPRPRTGQRVHVVLHAGVIRIEDEGRIVPCGREKVCARLSTGRRVEGRLEAGGILVGRLR